MVGDLSPGICRHVSRKVAMTQPVGSQAFGKGLTHETMTRNCDIVSGLSTVFQSGGQHASIIAIASTTCYGEQ